jgi:phage terminase large subunit-like protein
MMALRPDWIFDGSPIADPHGRGERAVAFLRALRHPKAESGEFELPAFWERVVRRIYGPSNAAGRREVKTVFAMVPRGARKTTIGAGLGLLHTFGHERVLGGQIIAAAAAEDQAALAADEARMIVRATPWLHKVAKVTESEDTIEHRKSGTEFRTIPADGDLQHGRTPAFVLADELHAWKSRKLWTALRTGLAKQPGSLLVIITTAGRGKENLAHGLYEYALKVAARPALDPGFLPILFQSPADCDWQDEDLWHLVNPGLAEGFPDLDGLRQLAREARERPADREDFRQYHLNVWLDHSAAPFVDMAVYDEGDAPVDLDALRSEPCWLAVDLSSNSDLTVIVACWRDGDDGYIVHPWFFCPAENLRARERRDKVPYPLWAEQGLIEPTPGNVVDFRRVEERIRDLCEEFNVQEIAFDPHLARNTLNNLLEDGLPAVEMRQGWVTMAPAIKELERVIVGRRFRHGGHPILRWHFENISIERDKAGNVSFHKGRSRDRIDGAVASAMAVSRTASGDRSSSIYDGAERLAGLLVI